MKISQIVAVGRNNEIGKDNDLPWQLSADLKYFKETTKGHHILMGRTNFDSIGRALPKRTNMVVTRNKKWYRSDVDIYYSIEQAISAAKSEGEEELFIIGGGKIYEQTIGFSNKLYVTHVEADIADADVYFPQIDPIIWKLVSKKSFHADEKNEYDYSFSIYERH